MFIDYLTMMLVNMAAGLLVLAVFLWGGKSKVWSAGLAVAGGVAFIGGLHIIFTWPLPGCFNMAFGETSVLLGSILLGAALSAAMGWSLAPVGVYALVPAAAAILLGVRIYGLGLTASPPMTAVGFILTGAGGMVAAISFMLAAHRGVARLAAVMLLVAALLWAFLGLSAYWVHAKSLGAYKPASMSQAATTQPAATQPAEAQAARNQLATRAAD